MKIRTIIAAALFGACSLPLLGGIAGGQTGPPPPAVVDFDTYPSGPQSMVPDGCDASGVTGLEYEVNGDGPFGSLAELPVVAIGDVITARWSGVGEVCDGVPIVLVVKSSKTPVFVVEEDQLLVEPFGVVTGVAGQPGEVSIVFPDLIDAPQPGCAFQLDHIIGAPLSVVGPNGSYYTGSLRPNGGPTTILSAFNGQIECVPVEETTTTTVPDETTTTVEATTTTEQATTTTVQPTVQTVEVVQQQSIQNVERPRLERAGPASMPVTGSHSGPAALLGCLLVTAGAIGLLVGRRFAGRR